MLLRKIFKKKEKKSKKVKKFYTANEIKEMILKEGRMPVISGENTKEYWWFER